MKPSLRKSSSPGSPGPKPPNNVGNGKSYLRLTPQPLKAAVSSKIVNNQKQEAGASSSLSRASLSSIDSKEKGIDEEEEPEFVRSSVDDFVVHVNSTPTMSTHLNDANNEELSSSSSPGQDKSATDEDAEMNMRDGNNNAESTSVDPGLAMTADVVQMTVAVKPYEDLGTKTEECNPRIRGTATRSTGPRDYQLVFYPFLQDSEGGSTLISCDPALEFVHTEQEGKASFVARINIANISNDLVTFSVIPTEVGPYDILPEISLVGPGEQTQVEICTDFESRLNSEDRIVEKFIVRATSCKIVGKHLPGEPVCMSVLYDFWGKYTTAEFPIAEEVVIQEIAPFDFDREQISKQIQKNKPSMLVQALDWFRGVDRNKKLVQEFDEDSRNNMELEKLDPAIGHSRETVRKTASIMDKTVENSSRGRMAVILLISLVCIIAFPVTHFCLVRVNRHFRPEIVGPRGWWDVPYYFCCLGDWIKNYAVGVGDLIGGAFQWVWSWFQ